MRNTKNSTEVQGTGTAQEQMLLEFNSATKELFTTFDIEFIKENYEQFFIAWVGSEWCGLMDNRERSNYYFFNYEFLKFLSNVKALKNDVEFYKTFISYFDFKSAKERFYSFYHGFLTSEMADGYNYRCDGIYLYEVVSEYLENIFNIYENHINVKKLSA